MLFTLHLPGRDLISRVFCQTVGLVRRKFFPECIFSGYDHSNSSDLQPGSPSVDSHSELKSESDVYPLRLIGTFAYVGSEFTLIQSENTVTFHLY